MKIWLKEDEIHAGDLWQGISGKCEIEILRVENGRVYYTWIENGVDKYHDKEVRCFQVRYEPQEPKSWGGALARTCRRLSAKQKL